MTVTVTRYWVDPAWPPTKAKVKSARTPGPDDVWMSSVSVRALPSEPEGVVVVTVAPTRLPVPLVNCRANGPVMVVALAAGARLTIPAKAATPNVNKLLIGRS